MKLKLAIPVEFGVPEIVYNKLPSPLFKLPADKVAVRPVTPVD